MGMERVPKIRGMIRRSLSGFVKGIELMGENEEKGRMKIGTDSLYRILFGPWRSSLESLKVWTSSIQRDFWSKA